MKATDVLAILDGIGIPREEDFITPAGGAHSGPEWRGK